MEAASLRRCRRREYKTQADQTDQPFGTLKWKEC